MASYRVEVDRQVKKEVRRLPGHVRQRVIRNLQDLQKSPRPQSSRPLDAAKANVELGSGVELRRVRIMSWRIVYLIEDELKLISVLAVRKRPPYQYDDLAELIFEE